jgi:HK97 family phage prohead protease
MTMTSIADWFAAWSSASKPTAPRPVPNGFFKMSKREFRYLSAHNVRAETTDGVERRLCGVIPYGQRSADLGGFVEVIAPGAFSKSLGDDIVALRDHDPKVLLGRTKSGTLRFSDEADGLHCTIDLPNTTQADDLLESVRRGDLDATSFGFFTLSDDWNSSPGETVRTLLDLQLFEVSPCSFPAYPTSSVSARSLFPDGAVEPPATAQRSNDGCTCECPECVDGNCADCSDDPCDCDGCDCVSYRNTALRLRIAARQ